MSYWKEVINSAPKNFNEAYPIIKKLSQEDQIRLALFIIQLDVKVCDTAAFIEFVNDNKAAKL